MLSNREKALVIVAYYKGTGDNDVARGAEQKQAYGISVECSEKILDELGITIDFETDFDDFMRELDVITQILTKEYDGSKKFSEQRKPIFCRICQVEYMDICTKHGNIPDSWEVRE
jgi:hypothetical protein